MMATAAAAAGNTSGQPIDPTTMTNPPQQQQQQLMTTFSMLRLTSPQDVALAQTVYTILSDVSSAGGSAPNNTDTNTNTTPSAELLGPSAALLACALLLIGEEEVERSRSTRGGPEPMVSSQTGNTTNTNTTTSLLKSPAPGTLNVTLTRHLTDLAQYCRTQHDRITVMDIVTYCIDLVRKCDWGKVRRGSQLIVNGTNREAFKKLLGAMNKHDLSRRNNGNNGGTAAVGGGKTAGEEEETKLLNFRSTLLRLLEYMSNRVRTDAETSADFTYLWDACSKDHRRDFAQAFLGSEAGYEARYEAMAEAARCAYVMGRYYRSAQRVGDEFDSKNQQTTSEDRVKGATTWAACIALVYRCALVEPEVRRVDEAARQDQGVGGSSGSNSTEKQVEKAIPSPSKLSSKRKSTAEEEGKGQEEQQEDQAAAAAAAAPMTTAADANSHAAAANIATYYYGPLRVPRTARSKETEAIDSLSALADVDAQKGDRTEKSLPDIVETLVAASNDLISLFQSSSSSTSTTATTITNPADATTTASPAFQMTDFIIEQEMERIYATLAVDKAHLNPFHSPLPGSEDRIHRGTTGFTRSTVPRALAPYFCSHWARYDSGRIMASLYFYRLIHAKERIRWGSETPISRKTEAFFVNPNLIEYSNSQGSFVQSSFIRYEALGAIAPTIRAGLEAFGVSSSIQPPVAEVGILDISSTEPSHDGPYLLSDDESMVEPLEENEWINSLLLDISRARAIKPSTRLRLYLQSGGISDQGGVDQWKDVVVLILNSILSRISDEYFDLSLSPIGAADAAAAASIGPSTTSSKLRVDENGELNLAALNLRIPGPITNDVFGAALLALYYFSLEAILYDETARLKTSQHPKLVLSPGFHRSLIAISCMCLLRAAGVQGSGGGQAPDREVSIAAHGHVDAMSVLELAKCSPFDYLKVSEIFIRSSRQGIFGGLPALVRQHVADIDELVIESFIWTSKVSNPNWKTLFQEAQKLKGAGGEKGGACYWPTESLMPSIDGERENMEAVDDASFKLEAALVPPGSSPLSNQYKYIDYVFRKISLLASKRISSLCNELSFPTVVATEIWLAFRYILRSQIDLLQDRHMDQVILATMYAVCRLIELDPKNDLFSRLANAHEKINKDKGQRACKKVLQRVRTNDKMRKGHGNIIDFYNLIYVPQMKTYLLQCSSVKVTADKCKELSSSFKECDAEQDLAGKLARAGGARQVDGTNVYLKLPGGKRLRQTANTKESGTRCIYSFGSASQKDLDLAKKLVRQGAESSGDKNGIEDVEMMETVEAN